MVLSSLSGFGVSVDFAGYDSDSAGDGVVLAVRGEVDILTSPELGAIMDAVLRQGYRSVVLDLAELAFMDASGLRVIARGAQVLRPSGGVLTIRSPSAMIRRLLDIVGLIEVVTLEYPQGRADRHVPERSSVALGVPADAQAGAVAAHPGATTGTPADRGVVDGALRLVVALARATVGGADGVSVSLRRHGQLTTVAASDQTVSAMDAHQYDTREGPCVDASVDGRRFHASSLATESRWPAFTPRARALGINAILSSPLLTRNGPVGALNIYSLTPDAFTPPDQELASVFAVETSTILAHALPEAADDQRAGRFAAALQSRHVIALAQGMIMQRDHVSEEAAYTVLQRLSRETDVPLQKGAARIVALVQRPRPDRRAGPEGDHHE